MHLNKKIQNFYLKNYFFKKIFLVQASAQARGPTLMRGRLEKSACRFYVGQAKCGQAYARRVSPHCHP